MAQKTMKPWEKVSKDTLDRVLKSLLTLYGTKSPRALAVWMLYKEGTQESHNQLLALDPALPRPFEDVDEFRYRYAATKLFSKTAGLNSGIDTRQVALLSAVQAEERCAFTNRAVRSYRSTGTLQGPSSSLKDEVISSIQAKIRSILGPVPTFDQLLEADRGWSPGRTTSVHGPSKSAVSKYAGTLDVTPSCAHLAKKLVNASPAWGAAVLNADGPCSVLSSALNYVEGNVMTVVPKNAKTDRVICYEPHGNIRLQLAVGTILKRRLKRAGCDLKDQSINQRLARFASKYGTLATIDLKSASDTLAREVVELLLPSDWYDLLDILRSRQTRWPDGTVRKNEKFASMGNGFTFELESLIFFAAAQAVYSEGVVSVFGDDIIVGCRGASDVINVLECLGFDTNRTKTFTEGNFRESCGYDAYFGARVTPVYLRSLGVKVEDIVQLHNAVRRWLVAQGCPLQGAKLLAKWRVSVPFVVGPSSADSSEYGDSFYHVAFDEATPVVAATRLNHTRKGTVERGYAGYEGYLVRAYTRVYLDYRWDPDDPHNSFGLLCSVLGPDSLRGVETANLFGRYRWVPYIGVVPRWDDNVWV